ncbi:MAG: outer membrane lipoprotein LolB [Azoarcus sp. PHD]|nr:MAG: outer membrane lipoprotein LolB [Azoarcus sp. PHD]
MRAARHVRRRLLATTFVAALLSACAPLQPLSGSAAVVRTISPYFELDGRLSATDGERAANGQIEWRHAQSADQWTAYSPLGQIVARLDSNAAGAELMLADGRRQRAASASELLPALIGVDLPLQRLPGWIQASPQPDAEVRSLDEVGRPSLVIDQGWRIDYTEYLNPAADALPRRLEISRGDARVRLVIDRWTLQP